MIFFFSSRRRHTRYWRDWSSDVCSSDLFTAGWFRPVVYVARELADRLPFAELTAVLAHERAHVERRDPLRLSAVRLFARELFWLPAPRRLAGHPRHDAEVPAGRASASGR